MTITDIQSLINIISIFSEPGVEITSETRLLEESLIDSMNVMQIISEIESQYSISIGAMDVSFDDFESPSRLKKALDKL